MINKILKEINRLKKELNGYSASEALDYIEAYINTISREPASEDLEEAAKHCLYAILYDDVYVGNPIEEDCIRCFKAGAEWHKQQMMKDAVEGVIDIRKWPAKAQVEFYDRLPDFDVRTGDKVKIIIVKEE